MSDKLHELVGYIKQLALDLGRTPTKFEFIDSYGNEHFLKKFQYNKLVDAAGLEHPKGSHFAIKNPSFAKVLFIDIETAPIEAFIWKIFDESIGLNQIIKDWHILSISAKWQHEKEVIYFDQRNEKEITNDKDLCEKVWHLLDKADIVVAHNGDRFDIKKINSRLLENNFNPPSSYRTIDTLKILKRKFGFTSNKLEFVASKLCKNKKHTKRKFSGFHLWDECLKGNKKAWLEMEKYNKQDVMVLEELYQIINSWDNKINFSSFNDGINLCSCGSSDFKDNGFHFTNTGKFLKMACLRCGKSYINKKNLISMKDTFKPV